MVGVGMSLCGNGGGGILSFHTIFLLHPGSAFGPTLSSSCRDGATDKSFTLLNEIPITYLGFFSTLLDKSAIVVPSFASSPPLEERPLAEVEAVESLSG
ncbi:hypothetical protein HAX54_027764, partial [Datura stramonium]|nr:hypothetical protein [Datura stramonium]